MTFTKYSKPRLVNHPDAFRSFAGKIESAGAFLATAKGIWDAERTIMQVGRAAAPYLGQAARTIAAVL